MGLRKTGKEDPLQYNEMGSYLMNLQRERERDRDRDRDRETDRQTDRQRQRERDRDRDRQTDRQTDRRMLCSEGFFKVSRASIELLRLLFQL